MLPVEVVVRGYLQAPAGGTTTRQAASAAHARHRVRRVQRLPSRSSPRPQRPSRVTTETSTRPRPPLCVAPCAYEAARAAAIALYRFAASHAEACGIVVADTKFEFGLDADGGLVLADEALTPDSSRFWPADTYAPGGPQPSFDKQFVRDWCEPTGGTRPTLGLSFLTTSLPGPGRGMSRPSSS